MVGWWMTSRWRRDGTGVLMEGRVHERDTDTNNIEEVMFGFSCRGQESQVNL